MNLLSDRQSIIASFILMFLFLMMVIPLHLLPSFFAGFLIFEIINSLSSIVERHIDGQRARIFISIILGVLTTFLIGFFVTSLISFVIYDLKGTGLNSFNIKIDQTLIKFQAEMSHYLPGYLPHSVADIKNQILSFIKNNISIVKNTGTDILHNLATMVIGLIVGILVSIQNFKQHAPQPVFKAAILHRIQKLSVSFKNVVFAQVKISLINTALFMIFVFIVLPIFNIHLPFAKTLTILTFIFGLLPIIGNLISNTLIIMAGLTISLSVAAIALAYLVIIHKLEYFVNAKIIGTKINASAWEVLLAMLIFESIFGLSGLIVAPVFYAYIKLECKDAGLI